MPLCTIHFKAASIQKAAAANVLLPEGKGPFPVLYLLHGLSDDYTIWQRRTSIERHAEGLPLIVVMPDGHRSWYCNDPRPGGSAYEDHIVCDVVDLVDRTFPTAAARGHRAVAGLSMGGYGALMLAMRHSDLFCAAASHSGAVGIFHERREEHADVQEAVAHLPKDRYDTYVLAERLSRSGGDLAIRMDCGREDFLLEANRAFHGHLDRLGIAHEYAEHPGGHDWGYWDRHISETLAFVLARMGD